MHYTIKSPLQTRAFLLLVVDKTVQLLETSRLINIEKGAINEGVEVWRVFPSRCRALP
jgi:hypothetical protein